MSPKKSVQNVSHSFASSALMSGDTLGGTFSVSQSHIPYRNSPLTKLLKNSLCGNSRTCIIVCITPSKTQLEQSLSSLRFGQSAMQVENRIKPNVKGHLP